MLDGDPLTVVPKLAQQIGAGAVVWNRDVEPYARERDRQVAKRLQADGCTVVVDWVSTAATWLNHIEHGCRQGGVCGAILIV